MKNIAAKLSTLVIALTLSLAIHAAYAPLDKIAVIVDDDIIMASEVDSRTREIQIQIRTGGGKPPPTEILRKQVIERLILESIQLQMAERAGIRIDDETLSEAIRNIARQNGLDLNGFIQQLQQEGLTYEDVREGIRNEMMINQVRQRQISQRIRITDLDVERFLQSDIARDQLASSFRLGHIFIAYKNPGDVESVAEAQATVDKVMQGLTTGESFEQMAIAFSQAPNALEGGELGWKKAAQLPSLFAETAAELQPGEISPPLKAGNGFHILKLIEKRGGEQHFVDQYHVRHILIRPTAILNREQAYIKLKDIRSQIVNGSISFEAAAREFSDDPGSASRGGDLDWVGTGQMVPEFESKMLSTEIGAVSELFSTQFGWHILEVLSHRKQDMSQEYRELQARNALQKRKYEEELELWLQKIRSEAYVDIK